MALGCEASRADCIAAVIASDEASIPAAAARALETRSVVQVPAEIPGSVHVTLLYEANGARKWRRILAEGAYVDTADDLLVLIPPRARTDARGVAIPRCGRYPWYPIAWGQVGCVGR